MCGIAGAIWTQGGSPLSEDVLRQMAKVIEHRGPDGEGFHYEQNASSGVALAHRRLSIIDLAGGKQPMCNEDETIWIEIPGNWNALALLDRSVKWWTESAEWKPGDWRLGYSEKLSPVVGGHYIELPEVDRTLEMKQFQR